MSKALSETALDTLFRNARSYSHWQDKPVTDEQCEKIYDLMKMGPTAANCCPVRLVFIKSDAAKERLKAHLDEGNIKKCMTAPAVVIIAMDMAFYEKLPFLFPHTDAKAWYTGKAEKIKATAERNSTLQGAYFMLAARSLGLDVGPMSGFNNATLDADFFADENYKANFICALGYGDDSGLYPRGPRLDFAQTCQII